MRLFNRLFLNTTLIVTCSLSYADANKGQKVYMQACKQCHGKADKTTAMHTTDEWRDLFKDEALELIELHEKTGAKTYFNSSSFKKRIPHLKDFFEMYGSDSGNIPPC